MSKHSNDNKNVLPTLNFDHAMVVEWFKNSQCYSPPKKHTVGNRPPFPALLFITRTYRDHRVLMNDASSTGPILHESHLSACDPIHSSTGSYCVRK